MHRRLRSSRLEEIGFKTTFRNSEKTPDSLDDDDEFMNLPRITRPFEVILDKFKDLRMLDNEDRKRKQKVVSVGSSNVKDVIHVDVVMLPPPKDSKKSKLNHGGFDSDLNINVEKFYDVGSVKNHLEFKKECEKVKTSLLNANKDVHFEKEMQNATNNVAPPRLGPQYCSLYKDWKCCLNDKIINEETDVLQARPNSGTIGASEQGPKF
ncbi:hypothetical protein L2E82_47543 [Cichorium intybus]|uniref:Uncharacterized protein n=1 Tax=Cichorium intybus TaxID=13427 RepID=A0ACB8YVL9_CICIN|nr:hypothetical protein L2E82_47543 [Cichorium intybus]